MTKSEKILKMVEKFGGATYDSKILDMAIKKFKGKKSITYANINKWMEGTKFSSLSDDEFDKLIYDLEKKLNVKIAG